MKIAVIGAGLSGLSAACHLSRSGHEVSVYEASEHCGGRAGYFGDGGFHIDNGPTVLTMTELVANAIAATGSTLDQHLELIRIEPGYRAFFAGPGGFDDDGVLSIYSSTQRMYEEIRANCSQRDADAYLRFVKYLTELYHAEFASFIDRNFSSLVDLARPVSAGLRLLRLGAFRRLDAVVKSYFDDPRLRKIFSFQALYAGLSPLDALAVYAIITYMDSVEGVWFPKGGMHQVAVAMEEASRLAGVHYHYGARVTQVVRRADGVRDQVEALIVDGIGRVDCDVVIATAELPLVYDELLDGLTTPPKLVTGEYSPSACLLLLGVNHVMPAGTTHHNIFFGQGWESSFQALLRDGERMPDPSILVSVPTVTDPSLAPSGSSILYALEPVPNLSGQIEWSETRQVVRDELVQRLTSWSLLQSTDSIVQEKMYDPTDWLEGGMAMGTPFGLSHRFFQSGPFRPSNVDKRVENLVFAGSCTVPGVGVPMVIISGKLAADRVKVLLGSQ